MNSSQIPTNQLHDINWGVLDHASRAPRSTSCNYYVYLCVYMCVYICYVSYVYASVCVCLCVMCTVFVYWYLYLLHVIGVHSTIDHTRVLKTGSTENQQNICQHLTACLCRLQSTDEYKIWYGVTLAPSYANLLTRPRTLLYQVLISA